MDSTSFNYTVQLPDVFFVSRVQLYHLHISLAHTLRTDADGLMHNEGVSSNRLCVSPFIEKIRL